MALATHHTDTNTAPLSGLAARVAVRGDATEVAVRSADGGITTVDLPGVPDVRAARRVSAAYRRLSWQRIDVADGTIACRVQGLRYRLPAESSVGLGAALALAAAGIPTFVHVQGGG